MRFERAVRVSHAGKLPAFFKHTNALVEEALRYGIGNLASASAGDAQHGRSIISQPSTS